MSTLYDSLVAFRSITSATIAAEDQNVKVAKTNPRRESKFPGLPGALVMHVGGERSSRRGTNEREDIGYPIMVVTFSEDRGDGTGEVNTTGTHDQKLTHEVHLEEREDIRRAFQHKAADLRAAGAPVCVYDVEWVPQVIMVPEEFLKRNLWVSAQIFIVWAREARV